MSGNNGRGSEGGTGCEGKHAIVASLKRFDWDIDRSEVLPSQ